MLINSLDEKHECIVCGKKFITPYHLMAHVTSKHTKDEHTDARLEQTDDEWLEGLSQTPDE